MQYKMSDLRTMKPYGGKRHYTHTMFYWQRTFCGKEFSHVIPGRVRADSPVDCKRCEDRLKSLQRRKVMESLT